MNIFDQKLKELGNYPLNAVEITTLQCNIGYKCNLRCNHCHVEASPDRKELMSLRVMVKLLDILRENIEVYILDKKDLQKDILIYNLNYAPIFY